jgi:hypothetical protein
MLSSTKRISLINDVNNEIKLNIVQKNRYLHELSKIEVSVNNTCKINKLQTLIEDKQRHDIHLNNKLKDIRSGVYDLDIINTLKQSNAVLTYKKYQNTKKKQIEKNLVYELKEKSLKYNDGLTKFRRESRNNVKEMNRSYRYYNKISTPPDYISEKLRNMTNNKGYIFKGVFHYGYKKANDYNTVTMFEDKKGYKIIHEWTSEWYSVYHKSGGENPKLFSKIKNTRNI